MSEELIQRITSLVNSRRSIYAGTSNGVGSNPERLSVTLDNGLSVEARNINVGTPGLPVGVIYDSGKQEYVAFTVEDPNSIVDRTPIIERHRRGSTKTSRLKAVFSYVGQLSESNVDFSLDAYPYFSEEQKTNFPSPVVSLGSFSVPVSKPDAPYITKSINLKKRLPTSYRIAGKPKETPKPKTYYTLFGSNVLTEGYVNAKTAPEIYSVVCTPFIFYEFITNGERQVTYDIAEGFAGLSVFKRFKPTFKILNPKLRKIYEIIHTKYTIIWRLIEQRDLTEYAGGYIDEDGQAFLTYNNIPEEFNWETKIFISTYDYDGRMCIEVGMMQRSDNSAYNHKGIFKVGEEYGAGANEIEFFLRTMLKKDPEIDASLVDVALINLNGVVDQFFFPA